MENNFILWGHDFPELIVVFFRRAVSFDVPLLQVDDPVFGDTGLGAVAYFNFAIIVNRGVSYRKYYRSLLST